jgi:hypothetical protein
MKTLEADEPMTDSDVESLLRILVDIAEQARTGERGVQTEDEQQIAQQRCREFEENPVATGATKTKTHNKKG